MIKDTIISAFNYDGTLLKWLKKVEDALKNASASEFRVNKKGNATISFSIVFANGDTLESGDIVLQQGESVTGATIRQGHLILTLSNGDELDAGDLGAVTGFSINESQHLIVTYQNGTTQDLGAIFNGTINVNTLTSDNAEISTLKPVVEVMNNYEFIANQSIGITIRYAGVVKNGNKLTFAIAGELNRNENTPYNLSIGGFRIPQEIANKILPIQEDVTTVSVGQLAFIDFNDALATPSFKNIRVSKNNRQLNTQIFASSSFTLGTSYLFRYEITFLLSDNMAS